jgi:two-component system sensor histidine kinase/response regulator
MAKILVIDDDRSMLDLLRVHLTAAGNTVQVAEDAAIGVRTIFADLPEIIICDINMPYLDGFELLEALHSDPLTAAVPVIFLTGRGDDESFVRARQLGVAAYLTKPVQRDQLLKAVNALMTKRGSDGPSRS